MRPTTRPTIRAGLRVMAISVIAGLTTFSVAVLPACTGAASSPSTPTPNSALLATLHDPAATVGDYFGVSVAVSGTTAVIGAHGTKSHAGTAYIYVKGASGWPTTPTRTLQDPAATADDYFGVSVAVSGTTAIIGAEGTKSNQGAAYIYVKGASGWPTKPTTTLSDPAATSGDYFGAPVVVSGKTAIIGAPNTKSHAGAAYIYVKGAFGWPTTPATTLSDPAATSGGYFGFSAAVSGQTAEQTAVIGAFGTSSSAGTAYIYVKGASGWPTTPTTTLQDPAATSSDCFGWSVAVSGKTAVVGALSPPMCDEGDNHGATYIYVKGASGWPTKPTTTLSDPAATSGDYFGEAVAVSGRTAFIGAQYKLNHGATYIYVKGASGWPTKPTTTLSDGAIGGVFGVSVAVSGTTAVLGAAATNSGAGAAYIYNA